MEQLNLKLFFSHFWRPIAVGVCAVIIAGLLLFIRLGSEPARLSASESSSRAASYSLHEIVDNPINAPFKVPEHFLVKWFPGSVRAWRATAVIYGALALILLFGILKFWQDSLIATLGTILFATSSWFLHTARLGTPDVLLFGLLALFACALWLRHTLKRERAIIICALVIGGLLYVPGFVWFILIGVLFRWRSILRELNHTKRWSKLVAVAILVIMLLPLAWAIVHQPSITWDFLGLPRHLARASQLLKNLYNIPLALFIRAPWQPVTWLGHLPILDVFGDAMFVLGLYVLARHRGLDRSKLIAGMGIISIILIALGEPVSISLLVPLVYLTIAIGVAYMLEVWFRVFPSNPVARSLGLALIVLAIAVSCNYQIRRYFVAWPQASATHSVFTQKPD